MDTGIGTGIGNEILTREWNRDGPTVYCCVIPRRKTHSRLKIDATRQVYVHET